MADPGRYFIMYHYISYHYISHYIEIYPFLVSCIEKNQYLAPLDVCPQQPPGQPGSRAKPARSVLRIARRGLRRGSQDSDHISQHELMAGIRTVIALHFYHILFR